MIFISHRGNLHGKGGEKLENSPSHIKNALNEGFEVEVDIWLVDSELFLGHDKPLYKIDVGFLHNPRLWCHAKNEDAFNFMMNNNIHCFWHESDKYTLTSKGIIWCYPNSEPLTNSVVLEWNDKLSVKNMNGLDFILGICSDHIATIKSDFL